MILDATHGLVSLCLTCEEADNLRAACDLAYERYCRFDLPEEQHLWYETVSHLLKAGSMIAYAHSHGPASPNEIFLEPPDLLENLPGYYATGAD